MRCAVIACLCACLAVALLAPVAYAKRSSSSGGRRTGGGHRPSGGGVSKPRPKPPQQHTPHTSDPFLDHERGSSSHGGAGTTHNRGDPFQPHPPSGGQPHQPSAPPQPIGFDKVNSGSGHSPGGQQLGFDRVNSEAQRNPGGRNPSAPPYPTGGQGQGPPPPYYPGPAGHQNEHPPAYPGRPINAPPSYPNSPQQGYPHQPGYNQGYPQNGYNQGGYNQQGGYHPQTNYPQGGYHPQTNYPQGGYHPQTNYPQGGYYPHNNYNQGGYHPQNSYPQQNYNPYLQNPLGTHPGGGSSHGYGGFPQPSSVSYPSSNYGGSPFGGYQPSNHNPYYNPNNFGYSNNPGYFGGGYGGYPQQKSRFGLGGLPIPIPIPIPIHTGGYGGYGSGYSSSDHYLIDSLIRRRSSHKNDGTKTNSSSADVFILNNSTVVPCTTDYFVYDLMRITTQACTMENCTAVKVTTTTLKTKKPAEHSASVTMCVMGSNVTATSHGHMVVPELSAVHNETVTACRNATNAVNTTTDVTPTNGTEATTLTPEAAKTAAPAAPICDSVECSSVRLCMPSIELLDACDGDRCPFRRTGFAPCVNLRMCRPRGAPVSSFASLNTTIAKVDEHGVITAEVVDSHNLTLISYHAPVVVFDCSNSTAEAPKPGCPPVNATTAAPAVSSASSSSSNSTVSDSPASVSPAAISSTAAPATDPTEVPVTSTPGVPDLGS